MLSATPGDTWLDYIPVFVANGFYKNRTEFKHEHVIYKPFSKFPAIDRYVGEGKLQRLRNQILVHMRYDKQTIRHEKLIEVPHNKELFAEVMAKRWHIYEDRPIKDIAELYGVLRRVVNEDQARIWKIEELLETHPRLVIFYNFNYELEALRDMAEELHMTKGVGYAEWNGWRHEEVPTTDSWVYLVQYVAGAEAWECTETDTTVFYSLTYSYKLWEQAHGRIDRMNTPFSDLFYYIFKSKSGIDTAIWRTLKEKKSFYPTSYPLESLVSDG
jgi:hypothetical protein